MIINNFFYFMKQFVHRSKVLYLPSIAIIALQMTSCMESIAPKIQDAINVVKTPTYDGCVKGAGLDISKIKITYTFPSWTSEVFIYRDGIEVYNSKNTSRDYFVDLNLQEGHTYTYECKALYKYYDDKKNEEKEIRVTGTNVLEVATKSYNRPAFTGINDVTNTSPESVIVSWDSPTGIGAEVSYYKVYAKLGNTLDMNSVQPVETAASDEFALELLNFGDELPYTFGVRACSSENICSDNINTITQSMSDGGAPTTPGVTKAEIVDGKVKLTIPWEESNGAVKKRIIYRATTSDISILKTKTLASIVVSDLSIPPAQEYLDEYIAENTTYYYLVRDIDPSNNVNTNTNVVKIATGDLTAPDFAGLSAIAVGNPADTALRLTWTAMDPSDASHYLVYLKSTTTTPTGAIITPDDPCAIATTETPFKTINSSDYPTIGAEVSYNLTGLNPRTTYRVCVKAKDLAGNYSTKPNARTLTTKDITPPDFDGVQKIEYVNGNIKVTWNPSISSDIMYYKVNIWMDNENPASNAITVKPLTTTTNPNSYTFGKGVFPYEDNKRLYIVVQACDNAYSNFATDIYGNCSNYAMNASATTTKSLLLGDTTKPIFTDGIQTLVHGSPANTTFTLGWNAIAPEILNPSGVKYYVIYRTEKAGTANPDDACLLGAEVDRVTADPYTVVGQAITYPLSGMVERTNYGICIKAADSAGNISDTFKSLTLVSKDVTPPDFNGVSTFKFEDGVLKATWTPSTSSDIETYRIKIWDAAIPNAVDTYYRSATTFANGINISKLDDGSGIVYGFTDNQTIKILVDACDNAFPTYNTDGANCTAKSIDSALPVVLDDTTPPSFANGLTTLEVVNPKDSKMKLTWTAIANQPATPSGASYYRFYGLSAAGSVAPAGDPCATGTPWGGVNSNIYIPGQQAVAYIENLTERTTYKFCVKAVDAKGNISNTSVSQFATTRDIIPPSFGGITGAYPYEGKIVLSWAGSASPDIKEYKVELWLNNADPIASSALIHTELLPHSTNSTGYTFDPSIYGFGDSDVVYMSVNACDNAADAGFGTQNCTSIAYSSAESVELPDGTPPQGFEGIRTATYLLTPEEGKVTVEWNNPGNWEDYRGFKVFTVASNNTTLTQVKDCPCLQADCSDQRVTCTVEGLNIFRTYKFHVQAYDAANNLTTYLSIPLKSTAKKTVDLTAPTFTSGISSSFDRVNSKLNVTWNAATDNQWTGTDYLNTTANTIKYKLYQKVGDFANPANPAADGTLVQDSTDTSFSVLLTALTEGSTYYYAVCAYDAALNKTCDSAKTQKTIEDNRAPTFTTLAINSYVAGDPSTWNLVWSGVSDVGTVPTALEQLVVTIYAKYTDTKTDYPTATVDYMWATKAGNESLVGENSSTNYSSKKYATYRVVIKDAYGYTAERTTSTIVIPTLTKNHGTSGDDIVSAAVEDVEGNRYIAGSTSGVFPGASSAGGRDVFVRKYSDKNVLLWTKQFGSSKEDIVKDIVADNDGVYVAYGNTDISTPAYLQKLSSEGQILWSVNRAVGFYGWNGIGRVLADQNDDAFIIGDCLDYDFMGDRIYKYIFISKYYSNGQVAWEKKLPFSNTMYSDLLTDAAIDNNGDIFIVGGTTRAFSGYSNLGGTDAFIAKFNSSDGLVNYVKQFSTSGNDRFDNILIDQNNNMYISGYVSGLLVAGGTSDSNYSDLYYGKFDSSGNSIWQKQVGLANTTTYANTEQLFILNNTLLLGYTNPTTGLKKVSLDTGSDVGYFITYANVPLILLSNQGFLGYGQLSSATTLTTYMGGPYDGFTKEYDSNFVMLDATP